MSSKPGTLRPGISLAPPTPLPEFSGMGRPWKRQLSRRPASLTGMRCWSLSWRKGSLGRLHLSLKCGTGTWWARMISWDGLSSLWMPSRKPLPKAGTVCCPFPAPRRMLGKCGSSFDVFDLYSVTIRLDQEPPVVRFGILAVRPRGTRGKLGALRLRIRLSEDRILPSRYYQPLVDLLVESVLCPEVKDDVTPITLLEDVCSMESRQDVATKLVKIFLGQGLVVPFLGCVNLCEISRTTDPNTLFRSNSLASKSMEQFMKVVGMPYLHEVLKSVINRIFEEKKYVELDPCKIEPSRTRRISFKGSLSEAQIRESSLEVLKGYLKDIIHGIVNSTQKCPTAMRVAFKQLHKQVADRFPEAENQEAKYIAISGFIFLRFFAPAILTPKLFNLRDQHADTQTSRTLLLLAKAVQSIGNLGLQIGHGKEQWMEPLHPFILASIERVKEFLDRLIDVDSENGASEKQPWTLFHPSATIKEGYLHKRRAEGLPLVSRFTFKKRYFWLSKESLSYSKSPEWQVRTSIPVQRICAVERVDENAFQQPHVMQITTRDAGGQVLTTYIQCKNVNELNQWLSAIRKVTVSNDCMLPFCHPGTFRGNRWTCCLQTDRAAHGCSRTHSAVTLGDWNDPLDPDTEAQMVYKHLLLGRDKLREKYQEFSGLEEEGGGAPKDASSRRMAAAARLLEIIQDLEEAHEAFECQENEDEGEEKGHAATNAVPHA
uniref:RAS protein activator like 1 n=1 Tax=Anolis carolinensis TaxID=28377 RepID=A0A803THC9_ANOCA